MNMGRLERLGIAQGPAEIVAEPLFQPGHRGEAAFAAGFRFVPASEVFVKGL